MFTLFGALALVTAAVGLYGVLAFSVAQRTHELGVRAALGARPDQLIGMVLTQAMRITVIGVGVGLSAALAAGGWLAPLLFNVSARDPFVLLTVTLTLGTMACVAAALPAWRATRIDPSAAFRVE
jgi:ABC-type antimicrobial peptide transport system permease subunit